MGTFAKTIKHWLRLRWSTRWVQLRTRVMVYSKAWIKARLSAWTLDLTYLHWKKSNSVNISRSWWPIDGTKISNYLLQFHVLSSRLSQSWHDHGCHWRLGSHPLHLKKRIQIVGPQTTPSSHFFWMKWRLLKFFSLFFFPYMENFATYSSSQNRASSLNKICCRIFFESFKSP